MLEIAEKYLKKLDEEKAQELWKENSHELMITEITKNLLVMFMILALDFFLKPNTSASILLVSVTKKLKTNTLIGF